MRRLVLLSIMIVSVFLFSFVFTQFQAIQVSAQSGTSCDTITCSVNLSRQVYTTSWGTTVVNDTVAISSTSNAAIAQITLGFPSVIAQSVRNATAVDGQTGRRLPLVQITPTGSNFTGFEVSLPNVTAPPKYTFTMRTILTRLLSYKPGSQFNFTFSPFPVASFPYNATLRVDTHSWSSPTASSNLPAGNFTGGAFVLTQRRIDPFTLSVGSILFSASGGQNNFDVNLQRTLVVRPSGMVNVDDNYNLTNYGPQLSSITFTLPQDINGVSGSDAVGALDTCSSGQPCITSLGHYPTNSTWKVTPRYGSIGTNQSFVVSLHYTLPSSILSSPSPGTFNMMYNLVNNAQFYAPSFPTRLVVPSGFRIVSSSLPYTMSGKDYVFQVTPVTPFSYLTLSMSYSLSPFWASLSPLLWTVLLELAVVFGALIVLQPGARTIMVATGGRIEAIRKYVSLNDEKSGLRQEADRIEEDMNRGAMNRHEYKRRRRLIDIRTGEIDRSLGSVKSQLSSSGVRYQEMVRRVERAEIDLQTARTSLADLRNQYRSGRIEKTLYESLTTDLEKRKTRNRQTIDNVIITLREEIR